MASQAEETHDALPEASLEPDLHEPLAAQHLQYRLHRDGPVADMETKGWQWRGQNSVHLGLVDRLSLKQTQWRNALRLRC